MSRLSCWLFVALSWLVSVAPLAAQAPADCTVVHVEAPYALAAGIEAHVRRELAPLHDAAAVCSSVAVVHDLRGNVRVTVGLDGEERSEALTEAGDPRSTARLVGLSAAALLRQLLLQRADASESPVLAVTPEAPSPPVTAAVSVPPAFAAPSIVAAPRKAPWGQLAALLGGELASPSHSAFGSAELRASYLPRTLRSVAPRLELGAIGLLSRGSESTTTASLWAFGGRAGASGQLVASSRLSLRLGAFVRVLVARPHAHADDALGDRDSTHLLASVGAALQLEHALGARAYWALGLAGGYAVSPLEVRVGSGQLLAYAGVLTSAELGLGLRLF